MNFAAIVFAAFVAGDLPPPEVKPEIDNTNVPEERRFQVIGCDLMRGICFSHASDIAIYVSRFDKAARELEALRASKGCAKLEVVPKKNPLLKKERDS